MNRLLYALIVTIAIAALLTAAAYWQVQRYLHTPVSVPPAGIEFEIPPGAAFATVTEQLASQGIIEYPTVFRLYGRLTGKATAIHAGEYRIEATATPASLLEQFVSGNVQLYSLTIVEGWNVGELLQALAAHPAISATLTSEDWPAVLEKLGGEYTHPEGLFLPETYRFPKGTTDLELLRQAYRAMQQVLDEEWPLRTDGLPLASPYEALILASIVEKETARADERARIAGVFVRRLQSRMRLQTDPTVIYGVGDAFNGNLTRRHLRTDTEYNTYTRHGLPPTPIALPGKAAIHAALNPADGNELFFVATGLGDGSHKFSATKDEHDAAVREYLARQRATQAGK
jgi:peptidoglycan lytic transglycosylase G